jgi:monofunctional glycosyltransferase
MTQASKKNRKLLRLSWKVKFLLVFLIPAHLVYVWICKYVIPPTTITQLQAVMTNRVSFRREYIPINKVSSHFLLAVIAAEDAQFLTHSGFDVQGIRDALTSGRGGGSSVSQQVSKNAFLWQNQDWVRKGLETYYTVVIEKAWGKKRILEVYINIIEFEKGIYGVEAASQTFFHKSASQLNRREAAMLAACLPNPKGCLRDRMDDPRTRKVQKHILKEMAYLETQERVQRFLAEAKGQ